MIATRHPQPAAALVTGGARRLGRTLVLTLARRGYDVALHHHTSIAEARALADEVEALGVRCRLFAADLAARPEVLGLVARVRAELPRLAVLVNNASVFEQVPFLATEPAVFDGAFRLHLETPFFLTRDFARGFAEAAGGLVVNLLDSRVAREPVGHFAYTLSKKALHDLTRLAAAALAPAVRVNGIAPGVILAPEGEGEEYLQRRAATVPLRRTGDETAIARALEYLLDQPFVTGEVLYVDGGEHLGKG
jgi:NAD(P)-dependent dehydrogenase (short-subunit alcohol dehydrogenase family)